MSGHPAPFPYFGGKRRAAPPMWLSPACLADHQQPAFDEVG